MRTTVFRGRQREIERKREREGEMGRVNMLRPSEMSQYERQAPSYTHASGEQHHIDTRVVER